MIGLDTNVLVRYIMQDDAKQSLKATRLVESLTVDEPGFVSIVSVVELGGVLQASYGLTRDQIGQAVEALLRTKRSASSTPTTCSRPCECSMQHRPTSQTA